MLKEKVQRFYSTYPYPSQSIEKVADLFRAKHKKIMEQILFCSNKTYASLSKLNVLDAGCGTGEKALFLAYFGAKVDAFDFSDSSISIAKKVAKKLGLKVNFFINSFEEFKTKKKYDLILCIGSLHHTPEAKNNFLKLCSYLKKNGVIVLGLYNYYGRLYIRFIRFLLKLIFRTPANIVNFLVKIYKPKTKTALVLLADKYAVPFESYHTIEEILDWFKQANIKPFRLYPKIKLKALDIFFWQLSTILTKKSFFFISGKKK
ncbi:MAG: methyltransferase domain-containing protein [Candidatus Micrarchaeota archaeon]|nr:methyltransferase domain-containing protein [Candidatus Micrarchaeota archaeon]